MTRPRLRIIASAATDVGRVRSSNEDAFFVGSKVFAVADGMGGHQAGEVASALALESLQALDGRQFRDPEEAGAALVEAVQQSNAEVVRKSRTDESLHGMGTTLTAAIVEGEELVTAHVGDSRAYLLRADEPITQLTTDHTLVERLVREGRLSREEVSAHPQRNVITRAIGNDPDVTVDALPPLLLQPGDMVLLCSDGLTGPLDDAEIQALIQATGGGQDAVDALIAAANEAGGQDNITVVLLEVLGSGIDDRAADSTAAETTGVIPAATPEERPTGATAAQGSAESGRRADLLEDDRDWASTVGRLGAGPSEEAEGRSSSRVGRIFAILLAVAVLLGLLGGGGWFLLSRAYFVSDHNGKVAIFRGLPATVAGVSLSRVIEDEVSDLDVSSLPAFRQEDVAEGLSAGSLREARQMIAVLREQVEDATPTPLPTEGPGRQRDAIPSEGPTTTVLPRP